MGDFGALLTSGLNLANQVLSATVVLTAFSLLIYLLTHNFRSPVARAFCALLGSVLIVYAGDVVLYEASASSIERWLKFQWIGIALAPAAYLHFSATVLRTTNLRSRSREIAILVGYLLSLGFLGLVFFTPWMVYDGVYVPQQSHLAAGPLFWVFALYFFITVAWGAANIRRARQRCLTRASRRRMTYLGLAFFGPGLGVFPYMLLTSLPQGLSDSPFLALLFAGNVSVLVMIVLLAYSVAYFGVLTPDRVVKHNLIHYLLRGPFVGAMVIFVMLTIPRGAADTGPTPRHRAHLCRRRPDRLSAARHQPAQAAHRSHHLSPGPGGDRLDPDTRPAAADHSRSERLPGEHSGGHVRPVAGADGLCRGVGRWRVSARSRMWRPSRGRAIPGRTELGRAGHGRRR